MTKRQKLNLLKCTRESYNKRLVELRSLRIPVDSAEWGPSKIREDNLQQAIRFCDYIKLTVMRGTSPSQETRKMLEYIGLEILDEPEEQWGLGYTL